MRQASAYGAAEQRAARFMDLRQVQGPVGSQGLEGVLGGRVLGRERGEGLEQGPPQSGVAA